MGHKIGGSTKTIEPTDASKNIYANTSKHHKHKANCIKHPYKH